MMGGKRQKKGRIGQKVFTILCLIVLVYSGYELANIFIGYYKNRQVLAEVQQLYYNEHSAEIEEVKEGEIRPQFNKLLQINPDMIGWITVDDTMVNYPILQADTNEYYLYRNYKKEDSRAGSIFMDYRNDVTAHDRNTIVYGHSMKDGSMFNQLKKFLDKDFFESHQTIYYDTLYGAYDAKVFAVYHTTTDFDYIQTEFDSDEEYAALLQKMMDESVHWTDVELQADDQILTLSTCDYLLDPDKGRFVVQAKLVPRNG
ncbi:class B sortase [Siminovitchia terrae]